MEGNKPDRPSDEEVLAMEISEDKRLREVGIDPNGDPVEIMRQVRLRMEKRRRRGRKKKPPVEPPRQDTA